MQIDGASALAPETVEEAEPETPENEAAEAEADKQEQDPEAEETDSELETDGDDEGDEQPETEPETTEIEWEGEKYKIPAKLKGGFMLHADYSRKTAALKQEGTKVAARIHEVEQIAATSREELDAMGQLAGVEGMLGRYQNVDWQKLEMEDPVSAQSHLRAWTQLTQAKNDLSTKITELRGKRNHDLQQTVAKQIADSLDYAQKEIQGWNPEVKQGVFDLMFKDLNLNPDVIARYMSPELIKAMHLAYVGHKALTKPVPKPLRKKQSAPVAPLETVRGRTPTARGLSDKISDDEWFKRRAEMEKSRKSG